MPALCDRALWGDGGTTNRRELRSEVGAGDLGPQHRTWIWGFVDLEASGEIKPQGDIVPCPELLNDL